MKLTVSPPSVNRFSRKCRNLDISQAMDFHSLLLGDFKSKAIPITGRGGL
jgi:hypothetical protein